MNDITISLAVKDGHAVTTSNAIAEHFGKMHKNVIQAVERIECSDEFRRLNFQPTSNVIPMPNGGSREEKAYDITRDGFVFLAMGFTGKKAAAWKERYILAFNAMEAQLHKQSIPALPYAVNPSDTLSKEQADELRDLVKAACLTLPKDFQAGFNIKVWSKLKAHFGVPYREIPASEFSEALAITARHIVECNALPQKEPTEAQIVQAAVEALTKTRFITKFKAEGSNLVPILIPMEDDTYPMNDAALAGYIASPGHVPRDLLPGIIKAAAGRLA